jgi:hypothetical protein
MKTPETCQTRLPNRLSLPMAFALALTLGACGSDDNPMSPSPDPEPDPSTQPEPSLYEVQIALSHLKVLGTCDGDGNPGEFDYTIEIWARDPNDKYVLQNELTGSFEGDANEIRSVIHLERFRVLAGKNYYVGFKATDRDPIGNEDDYVGYAQDVNTAGGQLEYDHRLRIGGEGCGMSLLYTATEIPM